MQFLFAFPDIAKNDKSVAFHHCEICVAGFRCKGSPMSSIKKTNLEKGYKKKNWSEMKSI